MNTHTDYLRIATWKELAYTKTLARLISNWPGDWKQSKWLQYKGWRKDALFIGHAIQQKKSHTLINVSGALANRLLPTLKTFEGWYCTRIDLQITLDAIKMQGDNLAYIRDYCTTTNTTLIESYENDTLYLGSRSSDVFIRLYEKQFDNGKYIRLEFELKGSRARASWNAITKGESLDSIFKYYNNRSKLPQEVKTWFNPYGTTETDEAMNAEIETSLKKKLEWLQSLDPAIMKYLGNHDIGDEVKRLIRSWAAHADHLDGMNESS